MLSTTLCLMCSWLLSTHISTSSECCGDVCECLYQHCCYRPISSSIPTLPPSLPPQMDRLQHQPSGQCGTRTGWHGSFQHGSPQVPQLPRGERTGWPLQWTLGEQLPRPPGQQPDLAGMVASGQTGSGRAG